MRLLACGLRIRRVGFGNKVEVDFNLHFLILVSYNGILFYVFKSKLADVSDAFVDIFIIVGSRYQVECNRISVSIDFNGTCNAVVS